MYAECDQNKSRTHAGMLAKMCAHASRIFVRDDNIDNVRADSNEGRPKFLPHSSLSMMLCISQCQ